MFAKFLLGVGIALSTCVLNDPFASVICGFDIIALTVLIIVEGHKVAVRDSEEAIRAAYRSKLFDCTSEDDFRQLARSHDLFLYWRGI